MNSSGNVGIGTETPAAKLEVSGGVKVANDTTCNPSKAGTIRWSGTAFEGCDGTNWVTLSGGGGGGITSCPSGWTMIGTPGRTATFCIEKDERSTANWMTALATCNSIDDATHGRAHLCTFIEWHTACLRGSGLLRMTNNYEWTADWSNYKGINDSLIAGDGSCTSITQSGIDGSYAYRCCLR